MQVLENEVHIWIAELNVSSDSLNQQILFLSSDELDRANRYRFQKHQSRFIAARGILRQLLGFYLQTDPKNILFSYQEHRKPALHPQHDSQLNFNLSHSENKAVYAFTLNHPIGIDIEKIQFTFKLGVAKRFFSQQEQTQLMQLPEEKRAIAFYRIWARKEALIKASGKGLSIPLSSFSVSIDDVKEQISLENEIWTLHPIFVDDQYQSAFATNQIIKKIQIYNFLNHFDGNEKL